MVFIQISYKCGLLDTKATQVTETNPLWNFGEMRTVFETFENDKVSKWENKSELTIYQDLVWDESRKSRTKFGYALARNGKL